MGSKFVFYVIFFLICRLQVWQTDRQKGIINQFLGLLVRKNNICLGIVLGFISESIVRTKTDNLLRWFSAAIRMVFFMCQKSLLWILRDFQPFWISWDGWWRYRLKIRETPYLGIAINQNVVDVRLRSPRE